MTARMCASSAASSGARRDQWKGSRLIRSTSTSRWRRAAETAEGGDDAACVCVCVRGVGQVPRCFGSAGGADGGGRDPNAAPVYDVGNHSLVLFDRGDEIVVQAGREGIRFLLVSGKPLEEPVAWYGPIVMNTQEQLRQAMAELNTGVLSSIGEAENLSIRVLAHTCKAADLGAERRGPRSARKMKARRPTWIEP